MKMGTAEPGTCSSVPYCQLQRENIRGGSSENLAPWELGNLVPPE